MPITQTAERADARHDDRQGQWKFDVAEQPPGPHTDDARRFAQPLASTPLRPVTVLRKTGSIE